MKEYLDIFDDNNVFSGVIERSEVHKHGYRHRSVHAMIYRNGLLLQKRAATKDVYPNCWDSICAGHVRSGESYEQALSRELEEEIGVKSYEILESLDYLDLRFNELVRLYFIKTDDEITMNTEELAEIKAFSKYKMPLEDLVPHVFWPDVYDRI